MSQLICAAHLEYVLRPDASARRIQAAVEYLRPLQPDVIVVTGISGIVLGARVAAQLPCKLAVVRREGEVERGTQSGSGRQVEGWLGGRWVFFDDIIATGHTAHHAIKTYSTECVAYNETHAFLGAYLHAYNEFTLDRVDQYVLQRP